MVQQSPPEVVRLIAELTDHRDIDRLETSLLKTVGDLLMMQWAAIYHVGDDDDAPVFSIANRGGEISSEPIDKPFVELMAEPGMIDFPIMNDNQRVLGYLLVRRQPTLSPEEQRLMTGLFRVYDNYLTVLRESQIDKLTGLRNRHTFDDQLDRALGLIRRSYQDDKDSKRCIGPNASFFLGEIDIDHFKNVNDRFGHLYGDEVLLIIARILQNTFRKSDLIYRFGGEEFVVIVYVEQRTDAEQTFERLRQTVENHVFPQVGRVTVSIGVTEIRDTSVPIELLGHADQALYYAKTNGRNQVGLYEALIADGKIPVHLNSDDITLFGAD